MSTARHRLNSSSVEHVGLGAGYLVGVLVRCVCKGREAEHGENELYTKRNGIIETGGKNL